MSLERHQRSYRHIHRAQLGSTAEIREGTIPHSWFIGFGPFDNPRLALAVIVENAGFGSDRAAPIAKQIFQAALK